MERHVEEHENKLEFYKNEDEEFKLKLSEEQHSKIMACDSES